MKKRISLLFISIVLSITCGSVSATDFNSVFSDYRSVNNAVFVKIPSFLVRVGGLFSGMGTELDEFGLKGSITGLRLIELGGCGSEQKDAFREDVLSAGKDQELLMRTGGEENVWIWVKMKGEKIKKIYIYSETGAEHVLVEMSGNFHSVKK